MVGNDSWFRELAYTARFFGPEEAASHGFISKITDNQTQLDQECMKLAETIASKSPVAINVTKKSIVYSRDHTVQEGLDHIAMMNGAMMQTDDTMTAIKANL